MLTLNDQGDIYDLLVKKFPLEKKIPLARIAAYLNTKEFSYEEYGYKKLKSMLTDLSFLSYETSNEKNHDVTVIIHSFENGNLPVTEKAEKVEKAEVAPVKKKKFTEKDKIEITKLLLSHFELGKDYPMVTVSQYLTDMKVNYKTLGFSRMKQLLEQMDAILSLKTDEKDKSIFIVSFLNLKKKKEKAPKGEKTPATKKVTKKAEEPSEKKFLPLPKKECFFIPHNLLISLKEITNLPYDNDQFLNILFSDYAKAYKNNDFRPKDDAYIFSLSFNSKEGDPLIASLRHAAKNCDYDFYVNYIGSDKEKAGEYLNNRVYFADPEEAMKSLEAIAKKESWHYRGSSDKHIILKIYLQYTFYRIITQNKLMVNEKTNVACFNTGLKDEDYKDIYCVLVKTTDKTISQEYTFQGFSIPGVQGVGKTIIENFNPLPEKATYISSTDELVYDSKSELHTDNHHIIKDNLYRFPITFLSSLMKTFPAENKIMNQILKEKREFTRDKLFTKLESLVANNSDLSEILNIYLDKAIEKAKRMVNYDYRNALPSFFPTRNVMSLMLPLEFTSGSGVQNVLLVEKTPAGNYQGQTILTLKQCYVNARLISPLGNSFLNPDQIDD